MVNLEVAVTAFVNSVTYVFGVETGSQTHRIGEVHAINHKNEVVHPYPREFAFRQEFVATDGNPGSVVRSVRAALHHDDDEHVLYVFSNDVADKIPEYQSWGYEHAWNNALMGVPLGETRTRSSGGYSVRDVNDARDIIAYQALGGSSTIEDTLADRDLHSLLCEAPNGMIVGRAQLVTRVSAFAYVSGMFTAATWRNRGVGTALMDAMHRRARDRGARFCLLIPSRMASEIHFYPKFNYETVAPHAVFIPTR